MQMSVGVDLHKGQFTVYWLSVDRAQSQFERYATDASGYERFEKRLRLYSENGYVVRVAVEASGSARYFKNRVERVGIDVLVINTLKFKVINESVKKTDRHDARTIAEFLENFLLLS